MATRLYSTTGPLPFISDVGWNPCSLFPFRWVVVQIYLQPWNDAPSKISQKSSLARNSNKPPGFPCDDTAHASLVPSRGNGVLQALWWTGHLWLCILVCFCSFVRGILLSSTYTPLIEFEDICCSRTTVSIGYIDGSTSPSCINTFISPTTSGSVRSLPFFFFCQVTYGIFSPHSFWIPRIPSSRRILPICALPPLYFHLPIASSAISHSVRSCQFLEYLCECFLFLDCGSDLTRSFRFTIQTWSPVTFSRRLSMGRLIIHYTIFTSLLITAR